VHRLLAYLLLGLSLLAAPSLRAQGALEQEVAGASEDTMATLRTIATACHAQVKDFWSYAAGQRCKDAVDAKTLPTPELARFVGDLGLASFLVSQSGDACQKRLQGGQDADKEKRYKLPQCEYQQEAMPRFQGHLKQLDELLRTRP